MKLFTRLHRAALFCLSLMPFSMALMSFMVKSVPVGLGLFAVQTVLLSMITLLPAYVGNYREYEVTSVHQSRSSDPNPDKETERTIVREGRRFPVRLSADILFFACSMVCFLVLPKDLFIGNMLLRKLAFLSFMMLLQMLAAKQLPSAEFLWAEVPGVLVGAVCYLALGIYLNFAGDGMGVMRWVTYACAVAYLFLGAMSLNKSSVLDSMSAHAGEKRRMPKQLVIRNRRIVIVFAVLATAVSLLEPLRRACVWLFQKVAALLSKLLGLNFDTGDTAIPQEMMETVVATLAEPASVPEMTNEISLGSKIIVYGFFVIVILGFLWIVFDLLKKLANKVSQWLEQMAGSIHEGFYDEKEELMSADEMRDQLKNNLKNRLKSLFAREKPWAELSGRERARRLLAVFYKKRAGKMNNLRAKTAKEAILAGDVPEKAKKAFIEAYDAARYSDHEPDKDKMDDLKKDLRL